MCVHGPRIRVRIHSSARQMVFPCPAVEIRDGAPTYHPNVVSRRGRQNSDGRTKIKRFSPTARLLLLFVYFYEAYILRRSLPKKKKNNFWTTGRIDRWLLWVLIAYNWNVLLLLFIWCFFLFFKYFLSLDTRPVFYYYQSPTTMTYEIRVLFSSLFHRV